MTSWIVRNGLKLPRRVVSAFDELLEASQYAVDTNSDVWDFAISMRRLLTLGAREIDLRWLVRKGYLLHAMEVAKENEAEQIFRPTTTFSLRSRFVVSRQAAAIALSPHAHLDRRIPECELSNCRVNTIVPEWDIESRRLWLDGELIKRFKWPAVNQEAVLCAFQEESWPERIDDPLSPQGEQDPKRRLADTIKGLNRKQRRKRIHFRGDGTGEGVIWELVEMTGALNSFPPLSVENLEVDRILAD